jgi:hypothetical protein
VPAAGPALADLPAQVPVPGQRPGSRDVTGRPA